MVMRSGLLWSVVWALGIVGHGVGSWCGWVAVVGEEGGEDTVSVGWG